MSLRNLTFVVLSVSSLVPTTACVVHEDRPPPGQVRAERHEEKREEKAEDRQERHEEHEAERHEQ